MRFKPDFKKTNADADDTQCTAAWHPRGHFRLGARIGPGPRCHRARSRTPPFEIIVFYMLLHVLIMRLWIVVGWIVWVALICYRSLVCNILITTGLGILRPCLAVRLFPLPPKRCTRLTLLGLLSCLLFSCLLLIPLLLIRLLYAPALVCNAFFCTARVRPIERVIGHIGIEVEVIVVP